MENRTSDKKGGAYKNNLLLKEGPLQKRELQTKGTLHRELQNKGDSYGKISSNKREAPIKKITSDRREAPIKTDNFR